MNQIQTDAAPVRTRTYSWSDPTAFTAAAEMSGSEVIAAMSRGELPPPPIAHTLDWDSVVLNEDGTVELTMTPQEFHYNPIGMVHGGVIATLLDTVTGVAVHATLPAGVAYASLDLACRYVRAVTVDTGPVTATGRVVHAGRRTAVAEATLTDAAGRLLATASSTCLVLST